MAGHAYITNGDPNVLREIVCAMSPASGFSVEEVGPFQFKVRKGNLAASIFVGAFIAYCDFDVSVTAHADGTQHLVIQRNSPWWTGVIGVNRVKKAASALADAFGNEILRLGIQIFQRNDF
ncbi:MAG: hypothetical protein ACYTDT_02635 [Planctomycetota bacterium]|jgi:hypothetical protein